MVDGGTASTDVVLELRKEGPESGSEFEITPDSQIFEALSSEPNS